MAKEDKYEIINDLIKDENEAIEGYDDAILFFTNHRCAKEAKEGVLDILNHIRDEELEHIKELKRATLLLQGAEKDLKEDEEIKKMFGV